LSLCGVSRSSLRCVVHRSAGAVALCACVLVSACASARDRSTIAPVNTAPNAVVPNPLLEDAARRSGVSVQQLRVLVVESVTWPDGSLGCPQPDRLYTQALVPGYRVRIEAPGLPPLQYHLAARQGSTRTRVGLGMSEVPP
jgi:hypothetical protein